MRGWACAVLLLAGCYDPNLPACEVTCGEGSPCPDGLTCKTDGYCHASGDTETCVSPNTTLTVASLGNGGKITSQPNGVSCTGTSGSGCENVMFTIGTVVTLNAHPFADTFVGWSGDECCGETQMSCMFTIQTATTVNATFQ